MLEGTLTSGPSTAGGGGGRRRPDSSEAGGGGDTTQIPSSSGSSLPSTRCSGAGARSASWDQAASASPLATSTDHSGVTSWQTGTWNSRISVFSIIVGVVTGAFSSSGDFGGASSSDLSSFPPCTARRKCDLQSDDSSVAPRVVMTSVAGGSVPGISRDMVFCWSIRKHCVSKVVETLVSYEDIVAWRGFLCGRILTGRWTCEENPV